MSRCENCGYEIKYGHLWNGNFIPGDLDPNMLFEGCDDLKDHRFPNGLPDKPEAEVWLCPKCFTMKVVSSIHCMDSASSLQ